LSGDGTTRPPYSGRALFVGEFRHAVREAAIDNRRLARQRQLPTVLRLPAGVGKGFFLPEKWLRSGTDRKCDFS
jgi:hypothetical protein